MHSFSVKGKACKTNSFDGPLTLALHCSHFCSIPSPSHHHFLVFPPSLFSPLFSSGGGGGGGGAQLNKANKKIDELQHKVMQKTEELMEMHKRQTESAEKIASLTAQLRSKEEECTKKDAK